MTVIFCSSKDGRESVLKEIDSFGEDDSTKILRTIELLKNYGNYVSADRIKHINGKIWEIKIN
jgi:hypothetical protein